MNVASGFPKFMTHKPGIVTYFCFCFHQSGTDTLTTILNRSSDMNVASGRPQFDLQAGYCNFLFSSIRYRHFDPTILNRSSDMNVALGCPQFATYKPAIVTYFCFVYFHFLPYTVPIAGQVFVVAQLNYTDYNNILSF